MHELITKNQNKRTKLPPIHNHKNDVVESQKRRLHTEHSTLRNTKHKNDIKKTVTENFKEKRYYNVINITII